MSDRYVYTHDEKMDGEMVYTAYDRGTATKPPEQIAWFALEIDALLFIAAKIKADRENAE
jgi:hypothetical protein